MYIKSWQLLINSFHCFTDWKEFSIFAKILKVWKKPLTYLSTDELRSFIEDLNDEYGYWDRIKYIRNSFHKSPNELWALIKAQRFISNVSVKNWGKYNIHFALTDRMQRQCHSFDMNFGGRWEYETTIPEKTKERYLISSLMEEAISSSMMEGASTTRRIAKEMLRKKMSPADKSQQMIFNNYETIQFIVTHKA